MNLHRNFKLDIINLISIVSSGNYTDLSFINQLFVQTHAYFKFSLLSIFISADYPIFYHS